jgi:hypothetical protein
MSSKAGLLVAIVAALAVGVGAGIMLEGRTGPPAEEGVAAPIADRPAELPEPIPPGEDGKPEPVAEVAPIALPVLAPSPPPRLESPAGPVELPPPSPPPLALAQSAPVPASGGGDDKAEEYWRERTASARDRLVATYESCLAQASAPYKYVIGEGRQIQIIDASAFAEAKAAFLSAQASFRFLQDAARRAGAPPGWVRIDWSSYPRTPSPEDGICERTLPEEVAPR